MLARYAPGTCHAGVVGVGDLGRSVMKRYLHIISAYLILVSPLISAESSEKLTEEVMRAFQSRDLSVLANGKFVTIITGDIPLGRGLFNPDKLPSDPDGLSETFPGLYEIISIKLLSEEESRRIEVIGHVKSEHIGIGYIQIDFKRNEKLERKAQITAFTRLYPYAQTASNVFLIPDK